MAYSISVPVSNANAERQGREKLCEELKKLDARRVILVLDTYEVELDKQNKELKDLRENCAYFHHHGFEVGAWLWTFTLPGEHPYMSMVDFDGKPLHNGDFAAPQVCPSDEKFLAFAGDYLEKLAGCGVDIVLFDDDLRYGDLASETAGCLCDNHVRAINRSLGTSYSRKEIVERICTGGRNDVRNAYLTENGNALRTFAKAMRAAVDRINPKVRIGYCCCMSAWDIDGTNPRELARLFAGNTRPLVRLIGAPYWNSDVSFAVEYTRMESAWTRDGDIELLGEGDVYPRPRTRCPAVYLEAYDTALRASCATDGILKYAIDYFSKPDYETGYREFHEKNRVLYGKISDHFCGRKSSGIRVYESMKKYADLEYTLPPRQIGCLDWLPRSAAGRTLSYCSVPTVYEGEGVCTIALGENARSLPLSAMMNGLITDAAGAKILSKRGIDVGINGFTGKVYEADTEVFIGNGNQIYAEGVHVYGVETAEKAEILSYCETNDGNIPMSYRYENAEGIKVLVWNFQCLHERTNVLHHYARGQQINDAVMYFGAKLPAFSYGNPGLYIQCKTDGKGMTVGVWNCCADPALHPVIELDKDYCDVDFFAGNGRLEGSRVMLGEISSYGFTGFEVR